MTPIHAGLDRKSGLFAPVTQAQGKGYTRLAIQEGDRASREFLRVTFGDVSATERQRARRELEAYYGQDTAGMIWIVNALRVHGTS